MDENGRKVLEELAKFHVRFIGTKDKKHMTNYSIILDSRAKDRTILAYKGASDHFGLKDISKKQLDAKLDAKWLYFSSLTGKSFWTAERLAEYVKGGDCRKNRAGKDAGKSSNIKIAFNPSSYQAKMGAKFLRRMLSCTDVLILNSEEAALVAGIHKTDENKNAGAIRILAEKLRSLGPKIVVITDGSKGAYCSDGIHFYFAKTTDVKAVETTGAGDCFASSFITGLIRKKDIEFALKLATANAESCIRHFGAKNGLLTWGSAIRRMKKDRIKAIKQKI